MTRRPNPLEAARKFAADLTDLLNRTVCGNAYVGVIHRGDNKALLGTGLRAHGVAQPVRLRTTGGMPCWLTVVARLYLDPEDYLTVESSVYSLTCGADRVELLHYDYERDKDKYPDAHLQICAGSDAWDALLVSSGRSKGGLGKLHLPVGGRRYRPALEDIIEALIVEEILDGAPGWRTVLESSRAEFRRRQLKAAVRRDPNTAVVALGALGYVVNEPERAAGSVLPFRGRQWRRRVTKR